MPSEIRKIREDAGISQADAAKLVHSSLRAWQNWEAEIGSPENRRMHPSTRDLFMIKLLASIADQAFTAWFGNGGDHREEAIARDAWTAAIAWVMGNDEE